MKRPGFPSLRKADSLIIFVTIAVYLAFAIYATGILQVTIFRKEPQIYVYGPFSKDKPEQLVILLHSANSSGADMLYLAEFYSPHFPKAVFVAPDSPFSSRIRIFSFSWYNRGFNSVSNVEHKVKKVVPFLEDFIASQVEKYNVPWSKVVIIGHSQGAVMGLYVAPRLEKQIAGVLSFSGLIASQHEFGAGAQSRPPVHLVHGSRDWTFSKKHYHRALKQLEKAGFQVSGVLIRGGDHDIDMAGVVSGGQFLQRTLP